jgi:ABC-type Na+ transport system ATPase subunit NatA
MTPTQAQIDAVRKTWPAWDDLTIRRHLQQRARLSEIAAQQQRARVAQCMHEHFEVRQ